MYCPNCNKEYKEDITVCPDCMEQLLEDIPESSLIPIKVASASSEIEAGLIMNLLIDNNIPCYKKSKGSGDYMNIYMGYSIYGEDIYVAEIDYNKAKELIDSLTEEEESDDIEESITDYSVPFYRKPQIVARILILGSIATSLLIYILIYLNKP